MNTPQKKSIDGHYVVMGRDGGWLYAALLEREKDGALRAPSFYIESRRSLSLYELYNRF
jgi:hypothetical protein